MVGRLPFSRNENLSQPSVFFAHQISVEREWHRAEAVGEFFLAITARRSVFSDGEPVGDSAAGFVGQEPIAAGDFRLFRAKSNCVTARQSSGRNLSQFV
jgi:hypothetical protein